MREDFAAGGTGFGRWADVAKAFRAAITPDRVTAFTNLMRDEINNGDIQAKKAYLRAVISEVRVDDDKISIIGDKTVLAAVIADQNTSSGNVSGFVRKWRTRHDSNV